MEAVQFVDVAEQSRSDGDSLVAKKRRVQPRSNAAGTAIGQPTLDAVSVEEEILRAATIYLVRKHGGLLVATNLREETRTDSRQWIITVTVRYPTGHEGYVGDLLYDGKHFSFLTSPEVRSERIKKIATDPEGLHQWNEYRAATVRAEKA